MISSCIRDGETLSNITRSKPFVPSKLSVYLKCPLRYLLETEIASKTCLPLGPRTVRGIAIHEVIARFHGKEMVAGQMIMDELVSQIARLIDAGKATEPLMYLTYMQHGIDGILSMEQLITACQLVRIVMHRRAGRGGASHTGGIGMTANATRNFGAEIPLEIPALDLAGRVDRLSREPDGTIFVTEFKSGRAFEKDGTPILAALMQLGAYGLMAKEKYQPNSVVLELIASGHHWSSPMDLGIEELVRESIKAMAKKIPRNMPLDTLALASIGQHCSTCCYRPSCPQYKDVLNGSVGAGLDDLSRDIAGTILNTESDGSYQTVRVKKRSGISARISGIPVALYPRFSTGSMFIAYSLGIYDIKAKTSEPTNFFMIRPDAPRLSAFESVLLV